MQTQNQPVSLIDLMLVEAEKRYHQGQSAASDALYRAILVLEPHHATAAYNLGCVLHGQGHSAAALTAFQHAVQVRPDYAEAHCNLGVALQDERRYEEAIAAYQRAIALQPGFAMAHCNLGVTLKACNRFDDSVAAYGRALAIQPEYPFALANLAAVLIDEGKLSEAVENAQRALALQPDFVMALFNLGTALKHMNRLDEAAATFQRLIAVNPEMAEAHFTLAQVWLMQGKLQEGWREYEWRWRLKDYAWLSNIHGAFTQPRWNGEALHGRTILLYAEQGLGDTIQYVRYVPRVVAAGGRVILAVHPPLRALFAQLEDVTVVDLDQVPLPPFDVHCPLLTLPLVFGTTLDDLPAPASYLRADPALAARWRSRIDAAAKPGLRVGIVWAGNPNQTGDRFRSPRLDAVRPLFDVPGASFIALQVGPGREDLARQALPGQVLDLGPEIANLADTAAIMAGLDLVISSCTAPLHLAAALGRPSWGMIPASPHFAWLMDRPDSVWYPTLRLYRQQAYGADWSGVIGRMASDLAGMAARTRSGALELA